jgi:hypothetical protein
LLPVVQKFLKKIENCNFPRFFSFFHFFIKLLSFLIIL